LCTAYTYLLTPWSRVLLEKLTGFAASQEIPRIYGTRKFIAVPTSARHLSKLLRDTPPRNTPPPHQRRSEWWSSLPPDCFVSRGSISLCGYYLTWVFTGRVVSTSPNPQDGGPPLVGYPLLLIQFIRSYTPHRRPFLHPQPEDAPCRGDSDPLNMCIAYTMPGNVAFKFAVHLLMCLPAHRQYLTVCSSQQYTGCPKKIVPFFIFFF
jgi:hypothetical protein